MEIKINLIPPYIKKEREDFFRLEILLNLGASIMVFFAVFLVFLFGIFKIMEINLSMVSDYEKSGGTSAKREEIKKLDAEFEKINLQTKDIATVEKSQLYWSNLFWKLSETLKEGVEVGELATKNYTVMLSGKAVDRESLVAFKENLEKEECFSEINLPLSNLVSKSDIAFGLDFKIKEECLRKQ